MGVAATTRQTFSIRYFRAGTLVLAAAALAGGASPVWAQYVNFPTVPGGPAGGPGSTLTAPAPAGANPQMLVQAREINYDHANQQVSAAGSVQIYYRGATLEADRLVYDQRTKRLRAEGGVRLTEADGRVTYGEIIELSENYRDGFVDSLRLDGPDRTRFAAPRAERREGNVTVFENGVYTACEPCKDDPKKPPLWQVKAARIIHEQGEKMIYFEDARLEFIGVPLAYVPYFSSPDPTVKRKSGLLMPVFRSSGRYGVGVEVPYFWELAPDYDVTFSPFLTTRQGPLLQGEFRQRLVNGSYSIRASGIFQLDKEAFVLARDATGAPVTSPGYRDFRGHVETQGQFAINDKWVWGWESVLPSDRTYLVDYNMWKFNATDPLKLMPDGISQIYLTGRGDRSYFDLRSIYFYGFSVADDQQRIPVIHPVMDYTYTFDRPIFGGELGYNTNLTSLSRQSASFDPVTQTAFDTGLCSPTTADPANQKVRANCLLRGFPGSYSRVSADVHWRRAIIDNWGQVWTPFWSVRADVAALSVQNEPGVNNFLQPGDSSVVRAMPTVGMEYRYPFLSAHSWGTQTIEPIAQVVMRPNETHVGRLPNEDAQSLIFDDSNLFRVDKFTGWDRQEGGGRANVGIQYTAQFNRAGSVNMLFGQSYHLFGQNSFAVADVSNTGLGSGLETNRSDYVARVSYQPDRTYTFTSRFRFDEATFDVRRFEVEARANFDRWSFTTLYGNYAAQPEIGFLRNRQGILGNATVKLSSNWALFGGANYDIDQGKFASTQLGVGYVDDCLILAVNYMTSYSYSGALQSQSADSRVMLQLSLRTLGGTSLSQSVGSSSTSSASNTGSGLPF